MKRSLTLLATTFLFFSSYAQSMVDMTISKIDPAIEKSMLPGDMISYYKKGKFGSRNVIIEASTDKGSRKFFEIFNVRPDESGHYTFTKKIKILEGSKVPFDGDIHLLVYIKTIFGNAIWTKVTRTRSTLKDPIILDHYSATEGKEDTPENVFAIEFAPISYDKELRAKVLANKDSWKNRKRSDFHFLIKNVGDEDWKINYYCDNGGMKNNSILAKIPNTEAIDLSKRIILRIECRTLKGNMLWEEVEKEAREMNQNHFGVNYSKLNSGEWEERKEGVSPSEKPEDKEEDKEEVKEEDKKQVEVKKNEPKEVSTPAVKEKLSPEAAIVPEKTNVTVLNGATDLVTKTLNAKCSKMEKGDSLINISGSNVCLHDLKKAGSKANRGTLAVNCNFEIDGVIYPAKAGETVKYNKGTGALMQATLRANMSYASKIGPMILKEGSIVLFNGVKLLKASLAKNTKLQVGDLSLEFAPNPSIASDIRLDNQGRLLEGTIAQDMKWSALSEFNFASGSRVLFKRDALSKVIPPTASSFTIGESTINVEGNGKVASYEFDKNQTLALVQSGAGNTIEIEGQTIRIKEGSKIHFSVINDSYSIDKFYPAEKITLKVYKKDKVKEVEVKAGKRVIIKDGKVVKAG